MTDGPWKYPFAGKQIRLNLGRRLEKQNCTCAQVCFGNVKLQAGSGDLVFQDPNSPTLISVKEGIAILRKDRMMSSSNLRLSQRSSPKVLPFNQGAAWQDSGLRWLFPIFKAENSLQLSKIYQQSGTARGIQHPVSQHRHVALHRVLLKRTWNGAPKRPTVADCANLTPLGRTSVTGHDVELRHSVQAPYRTGKGLVGAGTNTRDCASGRQGFSAWHCRLSRLSRRDAPATVNRD